MSRPQPDASSPEQKPAPDGVTAEGAAYVSARLQYLEVAVPQPGAAVLVAPGIYWCRIPLPIDLDHINVWLLETGDGCVLVDTGIASAMGKAAWEAIEKDVLATRPLRAIFITHIHPDHIGLAAWLQQRHDVPVLMSERTYLQVQYVLDPNNKPVPQEAEAYFRSNGVEDLATLQPMFTVNRIAKMTSGTPAVKQLVADGEVLQWGAHAWTAIETNGHADGHLCLSDAAQRLLISGDQVLPTISSNISLTWRNRDLNPLDSFLKSLQQLRSLSEDTLVLPSHGVPFRGLRQRIDDLTAHHEEQLAAIVAACAQPRTVADLLPVMYRRSLAGMHMFLATAEALAHVEYLALAGRLERRQDAQGVSRYSAA